MRLHPLRKAYCRYIHKEYGEKIWGDSNPERTEVVADKVKRLGISYEMFIHLAILIWGNWAAKQGHSYPYWNVVTSDKTIEQLKQYIDLIRDMEDAGLDGHAFAAELGYAIGYVEWINGKSEHRPAKPPMDIPRGIKILVAEYLCDYYGLSCVTNNYNYIAKQVAKYER